MMKRLALNYQNPKGVLGNLTLHKMNHHHKPLMDWTFQKLALRFDFKALDIGCGGGKMIKRLAKLLPYGKVYGLDLSPLSVRHSKWENLRNVRRHTVKIVEGDVCKLPFKSNNFDLITAIETIYYWQEPERGFQEVLRVLKPGGKFVIACELSENGKTLPKKWSHIGEEVSLYLPSAKDLKQKLLDLGFLCVQSKMHSKYGWLYVIAEK